MVKRINNLTVALVSDKINCASLDPKSAQLAYTAEKYSLPILKSVVKEFETALKEETGIGEDEVPFETIETKLEKGGINFTITTTPSTSTSYKSIGLRIEQYLEDIQSLNEGGIRREGVRTIEDKPHILLEDITSKIANLSEEYTSDTAPTKIGYSKMRKEGDIQRLINIELGTYSKLTGENAKTYRIAKEQTKILSKKVITPFKDILKQEIGWSKDNIPDETKVDTLKIGDYVYVVSTAPKEDVKYGNAAKGFMKFVAGAESFARRREGKLYLPVDVLVEDYNQRVENNSTRIIQQDIKIMPQPVYDQVFVF